MPPDDAPQLRGLITTKLFVPRSRAGCVARPRLHSRLDQGLGGPLTLVCAAAGWGKTTLVADWLHRNTHRAAWLSLDDNDGDTSRLLAYLLAALRSVHPQLAPTLDPTGPEPTDPQVALTEIVNGLAEWGQETILVLDDLHHIDAPGAHALLGFLIEAAPPNLHLVITTRVDPPLPLARLRARGQLTEIRAPQLRFSVDEVRAFFEDAMGLPLPPDALGRLETRTEGWAAGLQMAALSLRGRDDVATFIENFAGSHRFVLDYLMEEVLAKMEPSRREALLRLSILRELSAPIVDALIGGTEGQNLLESLEAENLFLVALDDTRRAYRFHHLFGTLLRHELGGALDKEGRNALHVRAAEALEGHKSIDEAFHHAIEGSDFDRAERLLLIDADVMVLRRAYEWLTARLDRFGPDEEARRPGLLVKRAWIRGAMHLEDGVRRAIDTARDALSRYPNSEHSAELTLFEAIEAQHRGRMDVARPLFDVAERDLPKDNGVMQGLLTMHRALETVADDRFEEALVLAKRLSAQAKRVGDDFAMLWARWFGAHVALLRGRPRETIRIMESLMPSLRDLFASRPPRSAGIGFVTLAMAYHARGELQPAIEWLERALDVMDPRDDPGNGCALVLAQADIEATRDPLGPGWKEALAHGEQLVGLTDMPGFAARLQAHRVRHYLDPRTPDDPDAAVRRWLAEPGVRTQDHPAYDGVAYPTSRKKFADLLLARALAHVGELDTAEAVATEFLASAAIAQRQLCMAEGHLVLANIARLQGDDEGMRARAAEAVTIAAPERLVSPFFGQPEAVVDAALDCARATGQISLAGYLAAYLSHQPTAPAATPPPPRTEADPTRATAVAIADPLSDRELEVLTLVAEGMSNAEIGRSLFVAPSTVKKHLEHVYDKLGVRRRTQAVARGRDLNLL